MDRQKGVFCEKEPQEQIKYKKEKKARIQEKKPNKLGKSRFKAKKKKRTNSLIRVKIRHVRKTAEFLEILSKGRKYNGKTFSLHFLRDPEQETPQIGVILTKKLAPKAVRRNYVKRLVYAFFVENNMTLKPGTRVIVRLIRPVKDFPRKSLSAEIKKDLAALTNKIIQA